ncbi:AvrD family protein [Lactobacillus sp. ESL0679]|uniref:AvrD family protein n=1 Tax=Lactobacillus sp. ESL0679 TaxID=2983209 RepID=UPI0023FA19C2|nr:AvrD family protein [Lactobacillus sp. ESL0679]MDF7682205.1 AvrD family protein [Lactobacillus sp. ESL0679]
MDIDDILGNYEERYFGAGHRRTKYAIGKVVKLDSNRYAADAKVGLNKENWSKKKGIEQTVHLSTIDSIILSCLMFEKINNHKNLNNFYLYKFKFRAGKKPIEYTKSIKIQIFNILFNDKNISFKTEIEGMKISIELKKSNMQNKINNIQDNKRRFIDHHLTDTHLNVKDINYIDKTVLTANISRKRDRNIEYCGLGSNLKQKLSILEWLVVFSQLGEALAYNYDNVLREDSNNMWMKRIVATCDENIDCDSSIVEMKGKKWRILKEKCSDNNNKVEFEAQITHELPY